MTFTTRRCAAIRVGAISWIAGALVFTLANIVAQLAWHTPYSLRNNNISDLGNVYCKNTDAADNPPVRYICSPLHTLLDTSCAITALLIILGVFLTARCWGKGFASVSARVLIVIGACGYLLAGVRPADVDLNVHILGALFIMGGGNIGLLVAGPAFRRGPLRALQVPTLALGTLAFAATILHFNRTYLGLGMGGTERIAVFALQAWLVITAIAVLRGTGDSWPVRQAARHR
ncbi:DUF998 domain-containing protein [Actinoallomurus sp. CA-150999]|uniref:DUF998 domain-containing protein n=1 Tax=Actinoallomurus sp. CA-150999 TaxID=3239887 RepID=UPI003D92CE18